jgi:tetratricopeptide (TPR) repeat protein
MKARITRNLLSTVFLCVLPLSLLYPQTSADEAYDREKKQAIELHDQSKRLESLSLFEDLTKRNPQDTQVLVNLADCLVAKAATIEDEDAAAQVRVRARGFLLKARELGDNSNLLQNLLQLIPENGVIPYTNDPAGQALRAGEAAFARRDFDEAIQNYSKALELQPGNYSAALYIGDSYFSAKNFAMAGQWYERASQIDPNTETAYRYYSDMLVKNGDMETARTKAIQAVIAEPYNPITWRGLQRWAKANQLQLTPQHIKVPTTSSGNDSQVNINFDPTKPSESMAAWLVYSGTRINWRNEEFKKHFPQEKEYRHSLPEEADALAVAASVLKGSSKKKKSSVPKDPDLALLLKLSDAGLLEPYVLLSAADEGITRDYAAYRQENRAKLESYLSAFVVPPAPKR